MAVKVTVNNSGMDRFMQKVKEAAKPQQVGLDALFNDAFLQKHTRFQNLAEFEAALGEAGVTDVKSMDDLNTDAVNQMVAAKTDFKTFEQMFQQAGVENLAARLKF